MTQVRFARLLAGRVHYAWVVVAVMFTVILAGVGVRSAPSVLIKPLQAAFGWDAATVSGAISLNILLFGLTGPFGAALMQTIGVRRTLLGALALLLAGAGLSAFVTQPWQLCLTWGVLVGVGCGGVGFGIAAVVANRWFVARRGLAVGLLTASNASGQLIFLPALAALAQSAGWASVPVAVALVIAAMIPLVWLLLAESPGEVGLGPFGASVEPPAAALRRQPVPRRAGRPGARCPLGGFLAAGGELRGVRLFHQRAGGHAPDFLLHGPRHPRGQRRRACWRRSAVFDLVGTTCSGWLTDRFNSRVLLFWYYGLRGLSLLALPFTNFDVLSLSVFAVFYGLDWVATVPPTIMLTNQVFGRKDAPVIASWIFCGHQAGAALAALGAGAVRSATGSYFAAFIASGAACLIASLLVLRIARGPAVAVAE